MTHVVTQSVEAHEYHSLVVTKLHKHTNKFELTHYKYCMTSNVPQTTLYYCSRLLYGDMRESSCDVIDLHHIPPVAFRIILEYIYSGMVGTVDLQVRIADSSIPTTVHESLCLLNEYT